SGSLTSATTGPSSGSPSSSCAAAPEGAAPGGQSEMIAIGLVLLQSFSKLPSETMYFPQKQCGCIVSPFKVYIPLSSFAGCIIIVTRAPYQTARQETTYMYLR